MSEEKEFEYYSLKEILKRKAIYYLIIGERSNGKTYAVEEYALKEYCNKGSQFGIIRRWDTDYTGKRGQEMFSNIVNNGLVKKYTKGQWTGITYFSSRWYLSKWDDKLNKRIMSEEPFAYGFALNTGEHDKMTAYPKIKNILFDEFLTRKTYLPDEFIEFSNVLSTIIRDRDDVTVFMCANTVNKYAPYFKEFGLTNIFNMKPGTIDLYTYGEEGKTRVAVEYCGYGEDRERPKKKSDIYFAFNNPKLNMITKGGWEMALYPHLPHKYSKENVEFTYFVSFNDSILQCEIISIDDNLFTYIHRKTTPLKELEDDLIYSDAFNANRNYRRKLTKPTSDIDKKIFWFYKNEKVFYQDNEVGEIMRNYLNWCNSDRGFV